MARKIGELFFELRTSTEALSRDLKEGERQLGKFGDFVKANPLVAVTGLAAAFAGVAFAAAQAAAKIDLTFRQVTNILGATAKEAAALKEDLRAVSLESGKSREEIAGLFRSIAESGPNGAKNVRAIADAAIALTDALGGDLAANAAGLDSVTDIFEIDPARAKEVAASLFAISSGRVGLNDVFAALSKIAPEAAALGVSFEQVTAFLTRFLDQGYSVKQVSALFKELADKGAQGRNEIIALAGDSVNAAAALAKLETAQAEVNASMEKQYEILKGRLNNQWIEFGTRSLPSVSAAMGFLNGLLQSNGKNLTDIEILWNAVAKARNAYFNSSAGPLFTGFTLTQNGGNDAPTSLSASLGKRFSDIVTATKDLERLSAQALRQNQQALEQIITDSGTNTSLKLKAEALQQQIGDALIKIADKQQKVAADSLERLKKQLADVAEDIDRTITQALENDAEKKSTATQELKEEAAARERNNTQLSEQVIALMKGKEAYEAVLVAQAKANAVESARQRLAKVGLELSPDQIKAINAEVEATIRLESVRTALLAVAGKPADKKQTVEEIKKEIAAVGQLADALSLAAGAASGIASAFGEAGRRIASLLGSTSQLLTALSRAQRSGIFTTKDAAGNAVEQNVGFLGALRGAAGLAGAGTAAAAALSFVGAAAQIADAVDLFGNKAREQARLLRERAVAFNNALADFAITTRTDLDSALRQNIANANQTAAAGGFKTNFQSVGDITAEAARIRAFADTVTKKLGDTLRAVAAQLEALAVTATDNEAKLRVANESAVARLREDLDIRRSALALGTDAAAQARAQLELNRQVSEIFQRYGPLAEAYIADLIAITAAENQLAAARARQAAVLRRLDDDDALLGGGITDRLQRSLGGFVESFGGQFAEIFNSLDFTSAGGLTTAKAKIRELYEQLAADGIDENERPIIDFLKRIFGQIDEALGALPDGFANIQAQLDAFDEWAQLFASGGKDLGTQIRQLGVLLGGQFNGVLDDILKNADLGSATGRAQFKNQIETLLAGVLADGKIDEKEGPLYAVLQRLLGIANQALSDAEVEAEEIAAAARDRRQQRRTTASNRIDLFDLTGLDAFQESLGALGTSFSGLFAQFDLSTLAGVDAAKDVIRGIFTELQGLSDDEILTRFGFTRDELLAALLDTDNGLDGLRGSLNDVTASAIEAANASKAFAAEIASDFLRSQGRGQEADIIAAGVKRDERLKKAAELGLGADVLAQIDAIYRADLTDIATRYAPKAAEVVQSVTRASTNDSTADRVIAAARPKVRNTSLVQDFGGLSELTGETLAGLQREGLLYAAETARATSGMLAILSGGLPNPPSGLLRFAGGGVAPGATTGSGGIVIGPITVNIGSLSAGGLTPADAGTATAREIVKHLGVLARREVKYLGDARL